MSAAPCRTSNQDGPRLTLRQTQVLSLIAAGLTDEEIGTELHISARTVRAHCDALRAKLNVPKRRLLPSTYYRMTGVDPLPTAFSLLTG